jgi:hypothetical protein
MRTRVNSTMTEMIVDALSYAVLKDIELTIETKMIRIYVWTTKK